jgi:hypothetical protein
MPTFVAVLCPFLTGNSSRVQERLPHVQQIQSNHDAFAALLADGGVVTWGSARHGGDSSRIQDKLQNL